MTTDEAAKELGLTPGTVRARIHDGTLHAVKHGRDHWLTERDLAAYRRDHLGRRGRPDGAKDGQPRKKAATPASTT